MIRKIHQKNCWLPMAAAGAAASHTNTTQITDRITDMKENFFLPLIAEPLNLKRESGKS